MKKKGMRGNTDYDTSDTTGMIDRKKKLKLGDLGFELPSVQPTRSIKKEFR